jgi:hypothetical protein
MSNTVSGGAMFNKNWFGGKRGQMQPGTTALYFIASIAKSVTKGQMIGIV